MCGLLGIIARPGERPVVSAVVAASMRDRLAHRGPDDSGLIEHRNVLFAHRRLSVIDPQGGAQPMWSADRRFLLIYNGELYNDTEIRRDLARRHRVEFRTACDTETLLAALATWGEAALPRLRGMFAFALYDFVENRLLLARDPLGIKPLYYAMVARELVVASQPGAILAHPAMRAEPDLPVCSAYLSTIRTTLGRRTMHHGVEAVLPGEYVEVTFRDGEPRFEHRAYWSEPAAQRDDLSFEDAAGLVREAVIESVRSHLRSDVPRCLLLSGGLDSAIIATICRDLGVSDVLRTWCAADEGDCGGDRGHAARLAAHLGAAHHEVIIGEREFRRAWLDLIALNAAPLSTPNETAIHAVAAALKPHATVALSGEGADELFAGYAMPLLCGLDAIHAKRLHTWSEAAQHRFRAELRAQYGTEELGGEAEHFLRANSWTHPARKAGLLADDVWRACAGDALLIDAIRAEFARADEADMPPEQRLLRVQRRINLTGLLGRLDTSTMAAGVEGRTPFADVRVAELAASLPFKHKFSAPGASDGGWSSATRMLECGGVETKRILRAAFGSDLPLEVLKRPKASFPLPFQKWLGPVAARLALRSSAGSIIRPEALAALAANAAGNWLTLWPLCNLALWIEAQWGAGLEGFEFEPPAVDVPHPAGALTGIG